jgi:hypothetical protein
MSHKLGLAGAALVGALAISTVTPSSALLVFVVGNDPVQLGLVASLNRPGGNLTGFNNVTDELGAKEAEADPETTTICNCTDCQIISGAPLRAVIITHPGRFVLLSGKPTE